MIYTGEKGKVTKIPAKGIVEVEIEDWGLQCFKKKELRKNSIESAIADKKQTKGQISGKVILFVSVIKNAEDLIDELTFFLKNESNQTLEIDCVYSCKNEHLFKVRLNLPPNTFEQLHQCAFSELNQKPVAAFKTQVFSHDSVAKELKIQPKHFVRDFTRVQLGDVVYSAIAYTIFSFDKLKCEKLLKADIRFSNKSIQPHPLQKTGSFVFLEQEIDLHLEQLPGSNKVQDIEKLDFQLRHLNNKIDDCIQNGVRRLTVIHGHGKGILREKVKETARLFKEVKSVKLSEEPKYGGGATDIYFETED